MFDGPVDTADLVTGALLQELRNNHDRTGEMLARAEADKGYPVVARAGRLIDADTAFVVVKPALLTALEAGRAVSTRELLGGSVNLWHRRLDDLGLQPSRGRPDLYHWPYVYEDDFIGYMAEVLQFATAHKIAVFKSEDC